ncbi:hypothetical protein AHAS_Ahas17G0126500 [Arachis hypogaea]
MVKKCSIKSERIYGKGTFLLGINENLICVLASPGEAKFNELRDKFRNELLNLKQKKDLGQTGMRIGVA